MARLRTHPGNIIREEFMAPLGLSVQKLASDLAVPTAVLAEIIRDEMPSDVSADIALRLGRRFGTSTALWVNLQAAYETSRT